MESKVEKKLYETLAEMVSKGEDKISVSSLCEKADVSRASFYIYYKDLDDFEAKCRTYVSERLFEQVLTITENFITPNECNILLDENDVALLKFFTGKHVYWNFAEDANEIVAPRFKELMTERWGEEYYEENKQLFEFVLNGSVGTLYLDIVDFNKAKFVRNMNYITGIVRELFPEDKLNIRQN